MTTSTDLNNIVQKYLRGESNPEELTRAMDLLADPYHNLGLRPVLYQWWKSDEDKALGIPSLESPSAILDSIHHRINLSELSKPANRARKLIGEVFKIAAVLAVGLIVGILAYSWQKTEPVYYTSIAPKGSISQMILPDHTIVYLNSGSEIRYSPAGINENRELFLAGEAWFDVTKNEKKPFVVHTSAYDVVVLGTQFNVKAYPSDNEIVTTLEEGSVEIASSENMKLKTRKRLIPGQQLVYNQKDGSNVVNEVNTRLFTGWKENKLIFINMNLRELIVVLERKYGVEIEVADNMMLDYHYDGTIKNETILEVLDLIKETLPIDYKISGQKVIIQKK